MSLKLAEGVHPCFFLPPPPPLPSHPSTPTLLGAVSLKAPQVIGTAVCSTKLCLKKKKHQILALKVFACHIVQPLIDASIQGLFMKGMPSYCMVIEERVSKIEVEILAPAPKIA